MSRVALVPPLENGTAAFTAGGRIAGRPGGGDSSHVEHLFENEATLCEAVTRHLATGLAGGERAVVIATGARGAAFVARLAATGVDVDSMRASGRLLLVDVADTLSAFMVDGFPSAVRFRDVVEALVRRLPAGASGSPRVRIYSDMADLLWTRGERRAAVLVDDLWNHLPDRDSLSLLSPRVLSNVVEPPPSPQSVALLTAEIAHRKEVERVLRQALSESRSTEESLRHTEDELRDFFENANVALHWVGGDGLIIWANRAELELLGYGSDEYIGHAVTDFHADRANAEELLGRLRRKEQVHNYEARLRAKDGSIKHVLVNSSVRWKDGEFVHTRCFTRDITDRRAAEQAREIQVQRAARLRKVTAAIADAVSAAQVFEAVVDEVGAALGASSAGLWLITDEGASAHLCRSYGYTAPASAVLKSLSLAQEPGLPVLDAMKGGAPTWIASRQELIASYPHLNALTSADRKYSIACLPVMTPERTLGALGFTFDDERPLDDEERSVLLLVARYSGQALERLRLLDAAEESRLRAEILYGLAAAVINAARPEEVFDAALDAIDRALGTSRASVLVVDAAGVMRFRAWRNLSEPYRSAVEGHSPWLRDARDPQPIFSRDVQNDPAMAPYRQIMAAEGIGSVGFIPLVAAGKLIGKFMVYYDQPRQLVANQLDLARAIANHVAAAISRFNSVGELQESLRFNELFTGIVGHDLRNPLAAMITSARVALARDDSERMRKPLSRILSSGDRMSRMIDQLLDFTRVRLSGVIPIAARELDLALVVRQAMDELDAANPDWTFRFATVGDTTGRWDPDRLAQLFSNLVGNAVQHGNADGGVTVSVDGTDADWMRVDLQNKGAIPQEFLPTIFEPLSGGRTRRGAGGGLGLGLYITQQIVKAHGGSISVQSDEVTGTTFRVLLPRAASGPEVQ